jgi:hypothetical protein
VNLTVLLYRNYHLQHRKAVSLGFFAKRSGVAGPYVPLFDPVRLRDSGADYLVFHRDIRAEVRRYWVFAKAGVKTLPVREPSLRQVVRLHRLLGVPIYESEDLVVWKLSRNRASD